MGTERAREERNRSRILATQSTEQIFEGKINVREFHKQKIKMSPQISE